jgi:hypothetical protein
VFAFNLSMSGRQKDEPAVGFDNDLCQQATLTRSGALDILNGDFSRTVLTLATLATILYSSLALNHELPSLSMPPAYKEERTEPVLSRSCSGALILKHPACTII